MTPERHQSLERDLSLRLTPEELADCWHFCNELDGMLIHRSHPEFEFCTCEHPARISLNIATGALQLTRGKRPAV